MNCIYIYIIYTFSHSIGTIYHEHDVSKDSAINEN